MMRAMLRRRAVEDRQAGVTMVVVVGLTAVMLIALAAALTGATAGLRQATQVQNSTRALDAAYAGVQDYIARLNADATYPQYGNPAAAFSSQSTVTLPTGTRANPAFSVDTDGLTTASTWAPVPGSNSGATFRYEVDNSLYGTSGLLRLRSTGRFGTSTRTIVASVKQQGFINYLYFTDFETRDPSMTGQSSACASYLWSTASRPGSCSTITFGSSDVLNGPLRSNDTITVCGSTFNGPVTTSNSRTPIVNTPSGCSAGTYNGGQPVYQPVLAMPATNTAMKAQTYSDTADNPGCLYTGPTKITLNSNGTMNVVSPWTKATAVKSTGSAASNPTPNACGSLSDLHSTKGARIAVLANNLLYVQSVPTDSSDPNYTATTDVPSRTTMPGSWNSNSTYTCTGSTAATISGSSGSAGWNLTDGDGTIRYPLANESPATDWANDSNTSQWDTTTPAYGCRNGDAFVQGTMNGKMTIASDNYVWTTGDVLYSNRSSDILGLVGNNGVLVWNPMQGIVYYQGTPYGGTPMLNDSAREIDAAILSPVHTFQVQNWNGGAFRGTLTVLGSIAQRFRGTVGGGTFSSSGYAKNYLYDPRFLTVTPPYYLKPSSAGFRVGSYASVNPAFTSNGVAG